MTERERLYLQLIEDLLKLILIMSTDEGRDILFHLVSPDLKIGASRRLTG